MVLNRLSVTFTPTEELKHSRKGKSLDKFEYGAYECKTLCVIAYLKEYISRRNKQEELITDQLIITLKKSFKEASIDTLRRWIKYIFIVDNIVNFSPHRCRVASSSKAKFININIDEIIRRSCWISRKRFFKCYGKEITEYALDHIGFNSICRVNSNVWFLYIVTN